MVGIKKGDKMHLHLVSDLLELHHHKEKEEDNYKLDRQLSNLERKQNLVEEFGTRKSRKKLQQMMNNVVEESNISSSL